MHYCIGDIHGCFDEFQLLISKILEKDKDATFILVGDLIDRGPKVSEMLEWAMEHISQDGRFQCIRGNHEQLAIDWYYEKYLKWRKLPVIFRRKKFLEKTRFGFPERLENIESIISFLESLPYTKTVEVKDAVVFRIVHAWYDYDEEIATSQHHVNLWSRNNGGNYHNDEVIVHGHTPTLQLDDGPPGRIWYKKNAINIDGGCVWGNEYEYPYACMLCSICLETLEEIYPWTLEERFRMLDQRASDEEILRQIEVYEKEYLSKESKYRKELLEKIKGN